MRDPGRVVAETAGVDALSRYEITTYVIQHLIDIYRAVWVRAGDGSRVKVERSRDEAAD
jgi:hypothetical protein